MLQWSSQYETGVQLVDTQHKVLFEQINKLEELTHRPSIGRDDVDRLLRFLEGYVAGHFRYEELCMNRFHCPAHETNKRAHAQFLDAFGRLKTEYASVGPTHHFLSKLHKTASDWIRNHIIKVDVALKASAPAHV